MSVAPRYFKFLDRGGLGCFSGRVWSLPSAGAPGAWMIADGAIEPCRHGIHVCRAGELAHWASRELYEVELDGGVTEAPDGVIADRARLVRALDRWPAIGGEVVSRSRARALTLAQTREVATYVAELDAYAAQSEWPVALYCGAMAFAASADPRGADVERTRVAFRDERARQSLDIAAIVLPD